MARTPGWVDVPAVLPLGVPAPGLLARLRPPVHGRELPTDVLAQLVDYPRTLEPEAVVHVLRSQQSAISCGSAGDRHPGARPAGRNDEARTLEHARELVRAAAGGVGRPGVRAHPACRASPGDHPDRRGARPGWSSPCSVGSERLPWGGVRRAPAESRRPIPAGSTCQMRGYCAAQVRGVGDLPRQPKSSGQL